MGSYKLTAFLFDSPLLFYRMRWLFFGRARSLTSVRGKYGKKRNVGKRRGIFGRPRERADRKPSRKGRRHPCREMEGPESSFPEKEIHKERSGDGRGFSPGNRPAPPAQCVGEGGKPSAFPETGARRTLDAYTARSGYLGPYVRRRARKTAKSPGKPSTGATTPGCPNGGTHRGKSSMS